MLAYAVQRTALNMTCCQSSPDSTWKIVTNALMNVSKLLLSAVPSGFDYPYLFRSTLSSSAIMIIPAKLCIPSSVKM